MFLILCDLSPEHTGHFEAYSVVFEPSLVEKAQATINDTIIVENLI